MVAVPTPGCSTASRSLGKLAEASLSPALIQIPSASWHRGCNILGAAHLLWVGTAGLWKGEMLDLTSQLPAECDLWIRGLAGEGTYSHQVQVHTDLASSRLQTDPTSIPRTSGPKSCLGILFFLLLTSLVWLVFISSD